MTDLWPYTARPSLYKLPGERIPPWVCACNLKPYERHLDPPECVTEEQVKAWRARHPEATCSERTAKVMAWLEMEFGR